jgi:hypothetical protein
MGGWRGAGGQRVRPAEVPGSCCTCTRDQSGGLLRSASKGERPGHDPRAWTRRAPASPGGDTGGSVSETGGSTIACAAAAPPLPARDRRRERPSVLHAVWRRVTMMPRRQTHAARAEEQPVLCLADGVTGFVDAGSGAPMASRTWSRSRRRRRTGAVCSSTSRAPVSFRAARSRISPVPTLGWPAERPRPHRRDQGTTV